MYAAEPNLNNINSIQVQKYARNVDIVLGYQGSEGFTLTNLCIGGGFNYPPESLAKNM